MTLIKGLFAALLALLMMLGGWSQGIKAACSAAQTTTGESYPLVIKDFAGTKFDFTADSTFVEVPKEFGTDPCYGDDAQTGGNNTYRDDISADMYVTARIFQQGNPSKGHGLYIFTHVEREICRNDGDVQQRVLERLAQYKALPFIYKQMGMVDPTFCNARLDDTIYWVPIDPDPTPVPDPDSCLAIRPGNPDAIPFPLKSVNKFIHDEMEQDYDFYPAPAHLKALYFTPTSDSNPYYHGDYYAPEDIPSYPGHLAGGPAAMYDGVVSVID
jgi:hypothetical protein